MTSFITTQRYASAVYAIVVCPFVRLSICLSVSHHKKIDSVSVIFVWNLLAALKFLAILCVTKS